MTLSSRMIVVLTSIGVLSGAFLVSVGILTKERIVLNKQREIETAITAVVPGTRTSQKLYEEKDFSVYSGEDEQGHLLGFALNASAAGFQDKILFMIGIDPDLTRISSLYVLDQKETPGLGAKITDRESFLVFWENKKISEPLKLRKPPAASPDELLPYEVNTISGATVSSEAVLSAVNISVEKLRKLKEEGKLNSKGRDGN